MTSTRKAVQAAVDAYFSGQITVAEAFELAYGPDPRKSAGQANAQGRPVEQKSAGTGSRRAKK